MTSSPHGLYVQGYTRATMVKTMGRYSAKRCQSQKLGLSSDGWLQLASLKLESLVIGDQHAPVNTFPGLVHTAPPNTPNISRHELTTAMQHLCTGSEEKTSFIAGPVHRCWYPITSDSSFRLASCSQPSELRPSF